MNDVYETIGYLILGFVGAVWLTKIAKRSLRDYFAGKAMQGAISGCSSRGEAILYSDLAGLSYEVADHMLKARGT